ncbi:MAG: TMEM165/GDT1 family protein [Deltaproteobacteria bacterium]|nr:TMEM165/GDT1 family protein [Deltaproteobacteria bacterium]
MEQLITTFVAVFLAELGDKTQLATFSFAANPAYNKWVVLLGSCSALVVISTVAVLAGSLVGSLVEPKYLRLGSGLIFIAIGILTLLR